MRARVKNISRNKKLENIIEYMQIKYPRTNEISSFEVNFQLESPDIMSGDTVEVIVQKKAEEFLKIRGKAQVVRHIKSYTGVDTYDITVKDSYDTLFEKQVSETKVYYDLYLCNTKDRHNSILHKIATELGFENKWDFQDVVDNKGQFLRVPFVLFEKDTRWIDELQTFMNATGGILYVKNGKLVFRPRNRSIDPSISFHRSNLMTSMEESEKTTNYNGIRLSYDRFEKLENQVVFNLAKKVSVKENTPVGSNVDAMRIEYITSSVSNPTLTKAYGYYFTSTDPNSRVEVELQEGTHYVKEEWKETQAVVKFYNPYPHTLYIDSFEIKGVPLVKYENNEFDCKNKAVVAKNQENFILVPKNKYIQTKQFAEYFTRLEYANKIYPGKKYSFYSSLEGIEVAGVYRLSIEEIQDTIQVTGFTVFCEANNYRMQVEAETYISTIPNVAYSSSYNLKGNSNYVDLSSIEKKVDETKKDLKKLDRDIHSRLFKSETEPQEGVQENDIWLNPKTNVWKKFYNNTWNPISEREILPNMKMYNSLENNMIKLQGTTDKVGAYLLNDGEQFGSMNGELAHVTFDKLGQFEAENPNNRVALNIKDPANPRQVNSQILLGVTDVKDEKWKDVIFALGDEASSNRFIFRNGSLQQTVNGLELSEKLSDVDRNIDNLAQADRENKRELTSKIENVERNANQKAQESKEAAQRYADALVEAEQIRADKNATAEAKKQAEEKARDAKSAAQRYVDSKLQQYASTVTQNIQSLQSQVDGSIETWFYDPVPTLQNEPARNWSSNSDKDKHIGDLYYSIDGKAYRFMKNSSWWNTSYEWKLIEDSDITKALSEAKQAKDTADGKRRVFVIQPKPPYDIGDMWVDSGEVWVCQQEMSSGYFSNRHWRKLKYTDDTKANSVAEQQKLDKKELDRNIDNVSKQVGEVQGEVKRNKQEINAQLVNANGQLTRLQEEYQKMDKNISNFETQVTGNFDSYESRLQQGNFVVTGNTVFDGNVNIVSKGTNERLQINQGSIETFRTFQNIEYKVSRMGNSRSGLVETDSKGKGTIELVGFKQPIQIICALSTVSFGKNLSDIICKAENITNTPWPTYKFYLGATNEHYVEPKPIKIIGQEWSAENAVESTLLEYGGEVNRIEKSFDFTQVSRNIKDKGKYKKYFKVKKNPKFKIKILRIENRTETVLIEKTKDLNIIFSYQVGRFLQNPKIIIEKIDLSETMNVLKKYQKRTNVKYQMRLEIIESKYEVEMQDEHSWETGSYSHGYTDHYRGAKYIGTPFELTLADFTGFSITASAATSTIGDIQGEGTVQYLAFETE